DARAAVDQGLEQRLGTALGQLEHPFVVLAPGARGYRVAPWPVGRARTQTDDRTQPSARLGDAAVEHHFARSDDCDPLAQPLGMGDHMRRTDDRRACPRLAPDQLTEPALA